MALTFGAIFVVELPDKTFLATLVMATRYRPLLVWIGVSLAFAVQTIVAVLLGQRRRSCRQTWSSTFAAGDVPDRGRAALPRGPGTAPVDR